MGLLSQLPGGKIPVHFDPAAFMADPELLEALKGCSRPFPCAKDHVLFRQGDPPTGLYILLDGVVTMSMDGDAGDAVLSVKIGPGSLLGLPGLMANQPYSMTATAQDGADVRYIGRSEFTDFMHATPQLALKILQVLAAEVRTARRALY